MGTLKEVKEGIEIVSKSISNIGAIIEAVQKGKGYLDKRYKDAKDDVCKILEEMNSTLITTSGATSIVTNFSFIDDPRRYADDLREFNNRIVDLKSEIVSLRQNIDEYRGHCTEIKKHAENIKKGKKLDYVFQVFGIDSKSENESLSDRLKTIYDEEKAHYVSVYALCDSLIKAIEHVHKTLGAPGLLKPEKVPEGQLLLAEYSTAFMKVESAANYRVLQMRKLIVELS